MSRIYSREAKNIQTSFISNNKANYVDVDLSFEPTSGGDIYKKKDVAAVKQAIKNLVLTNHLEKPFLPLYGGNITALLFELAYDDVDEDVRDNIINNIKIYEPRAEILDIDVKAFPDTNSIRVTIEFKVLNNPQIVTFTTVISRLR